MKDAVGYLRVSTREQGRSVLGLKAQRFEIEAFGKREGFSVKSWYGVQTDFLVALQVAALFAYGGVGTIRANSTALSHLAVRSTAF